MDERRKVFRIKNTGDFRAEINNKEVDVIELSAISVSLRDALWVPLQGLMKLKINFVAMEMNYTFFKKDHDFVVLLFNQEKETTLLLEILQKIKK